MNVFKVFEMFSGYGGASFALDKAGIPFKCVGYSEIDKYAIQCYNQNHQGIKNYGDATLINSDDIPDFDLLTGGFPCQPFSTAGKKMGIDDKKGLLVNEIIRIANIKKPRYMLLENVRDLTFPRNKTFYNYVLKNLKDIGYYVHANILKSNDYGIPQTRPRIWFICFKDINDYKDFYYPVQRKLTTTLADILDKDVDEKYMTEKNKISVLYDKFPQYIYRKRPYTNTLTASGCGAKCASQFKEAAILLSDIYNSIGVYRGLTPKEAFKLMGFNGEINLANIPEAQQYKLAGNGWEINIVSLIFIAMFGKKVNIFDINTEQKTLFAF